MTTDNLGCPPDRPLGTLAVLALLVTVAALALTAGVALGQGGLELGEVAYEERDTDLDGLNDTVRLSAAINNTNATRSWVFAIEVGLFNGDTQVDLESANGRLDPGASTEVTLSVGTQSGSTMAEYDVDVVLHAIDLNGDVVGEASIMVVLYPLGIYELEIDVDQGSVEALENTTTSFNITVTSLSNNPTGVELNVTPTEGWTYQVDAPTMTLEPDGQDSVVLTVHVPPNAAPGSREVLVIEASAVRNRTAFTSTSVTVIVAMQVFDVTLDIDAQAVLIASGETVNVEGVVRNQGNNLDNVSLLLELPEGWVAEFEPPYLLLGRNRSGGFVMHLTAPADLVEAGKLDVMIVARSSGLVEEEERTLTVIYNTAELVIDGGNVTLNPSNPAVGETVTLQAGIRNSGAIAVEDLVVVVRTGSGEVARTTVPSLLPDGLGVATLSWVPSPGTSLVRVIVDPDDRVPETNETNNEHRFTLVVSSPDLAVSRNNVSLDPDYPVEGASVKVLVTVRNEAGVPAGPFQVVVEVDEEPLETFEVTDGLVGGGSVTLEGTWTALGGKHTFTVSVDPDDEVLEEDHGDNQASRQFTVNSRPIANLTSDRDVVPVDEALQLDGSGSQDPDGRVRQWFFDYGDGTDSGWVFTAMINHSYTQAGRYEVRLLVRDEGGAQSADPSVVEVVVDDPSTSEEPAPGPGLGAALLAMAIVIVVVVGRARRAKVRR